MTLLCETLCGANNHTGRNKASECCGLGGGGSGIKQTTKRIECYGKKLVDEEANYISMFISEDMDGQTGIYVAP